MVGRLKGGRIREKQRYVELEIRKGREIKESERTRVEKKMKDLLSISSTLNTHIFRMYIRFGSFYFLLETAKRHLYEKHVCKTLMKLTPREKENM